MKRPLLFLSAFVFACSLALIAQQVEAKSRHRHKESEHLKVGDRTTLSETDKPSPSVVDSQTWKLVTLRCDTGDERHESINIRSLVSPEWLKANEVRIDAVVPLPLDLEEAGLPVDVQAKVTAINPCPTIKPGRGRIVLSTVDFLASDVIEMACQHPDGHRETVNRSGTHRYYSVDRDDWIELKDAKPNETVRGLGQEIFKILSIQPTGRTERIFDLTVEGDLPYHTGLHQEILQHGEKRHQAAIQGSLHQKDTERNSAENKTGNHVGAPVSARPHAKIPTHVWTYGAAGNRLQNAKDHWKKHGNQFPELKSEKEYIQFAYDFVQSAPMKKKRKNGDTIFFDPKSGVFAITDKHGIMRTCFKPSGGLNYYNRQD